MSPRLALAAPPPGPPPQAAMATSRPSSTAALFIAPSSPRDRLMLRSRWRPVSGPTAGLPPPAPTYAPPVPGRVEVRRGGGGTRPARSSRRDRSLTYQGSHAWSKSAVSRPAWLGWTSPESCALPDWPRSPAADQDQQSNGNVRQGGAEAGAARSAGTACRRRGAAAPWKHDDPQRERRDELGLPPPTKPRRAMVRSSFPSPPSRWAPREFPHRGLDLFGERAQT